VGVGVDTGVHVYAALLDARRAGLAPQAAADAARRRTARAVLLAAMTAAAAFAALGLSDIKAVRQLGILCAAGEVLTALAIVLVTPQIGAWLERGTPPPPPPARWTGAFAWIAATRTRALVTATLALAPVAFLAIIGRADRVVEGLAAVPEVETVDALTTLAPALATQRARLAERDALDLPAKADELTRALRDTGFTPERFAPVLASMRVPSHDLLDVPQLETTPSAIMLSRYLGRDGAETMIALYVQPRSTADAVERCEAAVHTLDPAAVITGYSRLETNLRDSLSHDLPRIGLVAGVLVLMALAAALRRTRDVVIAALVVIGEVAAVLVLFRVTGIPLHAYSALVLPVLLGITVDEGMFLLHRAAESTGPNAIAETLRAEGPPIAATALTTAAGFGALVFSDFDGLRDLGLAGALGSTAGLVMALTIVPVGLRLFQKAARAPRI